MMRLFLTLQAFNCCGHLPGTYDDKGYFPSQKTLGHFTERTHFQKLVKLPPSLILLLRRIGYKLSLFPLLFLHANCCATIAAWKDTEWYKAAITVLSGSVGQLGILEGYVSDTSSPHQDLSWGNSIARTPLIQTLTALHVWWLEWLSVTTSDGAVNKTSFELLGRPPSWGQVPRVSITRKLGRSWIPLYNFRSHVTPLLEWSEASP